MARTQLHVLDSPINSTPGHHAPVIVVGLDGSTTSWDAFSWAAGETSRTHGTLITVYVAPAVEPGAVFGAPMSYGVCQETRDQIVRELSDEVDERARNLGVAVRFVREVGSPTDALTRFARSVDADLIVVGKSSKARHHLFGSLGRRLVSRHDGPPVVVVP